MVRAFHLESYQGFCETPAMPVLPLFDEPFLRAQWDAEFSAFQEGPESAALLLRLKAWAGREQLNERASETAFIQRFFVETWGYSLQGQDAGNDRSRFFERIEVIEREIDVGLAIIERMEVVEADTPPGTTSPHRIFRFPRFSRLPPSPQP
jgi:hypothetical protein